MTNRQWLLASRPVGMVQESDFRLHDAADPTPGEGQVLVRNTWFPLELSLIHI